MITYTLKEMQRIVALDHEARKAYAKDSNVKLEMLETDGRYKPMLGSEHTLLNYPGSVFVRVASEPRYRPFKYDEHEKFIGKFVRYRKDVNIVMIITGCNDLVVQLGLNTTIVYYQQLLDDYVFTDGSPCGMEII